jgi:ABC-type branched-subunit amino acid transport system substrate-binding protein
MAVGAFCICATRTYPQDAAKLHLRIGLVVPTDGREITPVTSVAKGVRLGAAESNQTATLFGGDVRLFEEHGSAQSAAVAAQRLLSNRKVQILIGASPSDADALSRFAEAHHILFLNTGSREQNLRAACRRFAFHVEATDAMYANAGSLQRAGSTERASSRQAGKAAVFDSVVLWGPTLERFGASQINDRYRDKYHEGMNGNAWAGWAAVKIAADAALRAQSVQPSKLLAYLESPSSEFDGHKGWPLTFRRSDHQLRQPLYIVVTSNGAGRPVQSLRDVPELRAARDAAVSSDATTRTSDRALDALIGTSGPVCQWDRK